MHALIVESPSKSKTISKYLGKDFKILSSFGHVRALPTKKGSAKKRDQRDSYIAKRGKRIYIYNKKNPRCKARQGSK